MHLHSAWRHRFLMRLQGLAKGTTIPDVGAVQVSWYTGQSSGTPITQKISSTPANGTADVVDNRAMSPAHDDSHMAEEEVTAGGWGDADDEFGML